MGVIRLGWMTHLAVMQRSPSWERIEVRAIELHGTNNRPISLQKFSPPQTVTGDTIRARPRYPSISRSTSSVITTGSAWTAFALIISRISPSEHPSSSPSTSYVC